MMYMKVKFMNDTTIINELAVVYSQQDYKSERLIIR